MSWYPEYVLDKMGMWLSREQKYPLALSTVSPVHRELAEGQCGHQKEHLYPGVRVVLLTI